MFDDFRAHLHRGGAYAYYHVLPQRRSLWYPVDEPETLDAGAARTNLYFSVHPCRAIPPCNAHGEVKPPQWVRSQLRYIAAINCLFAEYDEKDYGDRAAILRHIDSILVPPPSALVASGAGVHAYWLLREPYLLDTEDRMRAAQRIQAGWVQAVGGDPGAHDLCRVLRVPGSHNFKYTPPRPVEWLQQPGMVYPLVALTAHLPVVKVATIERVKYVPAGERPIEAFNRDTPVGSVLERRGYKWEGRRKMLSPYSSTGSPGVTIDEDTNRAFCHHGSDPLHDGYWKRPFDVIRVLDFGGDFRRALAALRAGEL